ncbi:MAG: hypothetical protein HC872_05360 [Gammaproteobacteria bacterium]|nr:hypothetical protein [Gammaproteobacteria bacterium]
MNRASLFSAGRASLWCALTLLIGSAGAQQTLQSYDVELVVFRNMTPVTSNEVLSLDSESGVPAAAAAPGLTDEDANGASASNVIPEQRSLDTFPALASGKYRLNGAEEALRRSRNYQVLAHIGWTQPGFPRTDAHYLAVDPLVGGAAGLGGRIALTRGRYLHLALDMTFQSPEDAQKFSLRQTRRMRSNERHYIDHPKFGVIALVVPRAG